MNIGYIYWVPQEGQGPEAHTGEGVCLTSSDDGKWVCWLNTMMQTAYSDQRDSAEWRTYYTVQSGILDGEYKITLAPPDAPDTINEISTG